MGAVEVELEGGDGKVGVGMVVEVGVVEDELVVRVWVAVAEFALDGTVAGADVAVQHVADNLPHVLELGQLGCSPVMQELGTLEDVVPVQAGGAHVAGIVEGAGVKPEAVDCPAKIEAFSGG